MAKKKAKTTEPPKQEGNRNPPGPRQPERIEAQGLRHAHELLRRAGEIKLVVEQSELATALPPLHEQMRELAEYLASVRTTVGAAAELIEQQRGVQPYSVGDVRGGSAPGAVLAYAEALIYAHEHDTPEDLTYLLGALHRQHAEDVLRRTARRLGLREHARALPRIEAAEALSELSQHGADAARQADERPCRGKDGRLFDAVRNILSGYDQRQPRKLATVARTAGLSEGQVRDWSQRVQDAGFVVPKEGMFVRTARGSEVLAEPE